VEGASGTG